MSGRIQFWGTTATLLAVVAAIVFAVIFCPYKATDVPGKWRAKGWLTIGYALTWLIMTAGAGILLKTDPEALTPEALLLFLSCSIGMVCVAIVAGMLMLRKAERE